MHSGPPTEESTSSDLQPPTKRARQARKAKPVQFDAIITLTDTQLREMRLSYPERMEAERVKTVAAVEEREGRERALDLALNASDRFAAPQLVALWKTGIGDPTALVRPKRSHKRKRETSPTPAEVEEGRTRGEGDEEVEVGLSREDAGLGGEELVFDDFEYGGGEGVEGLGEVEEGRAGTLIGSQRQSLPWNVEAERAASEAAYGAHWFTLIRMTSYHPC